ncbi:MAG: hypothetical protein M1385_02915 [Candidatus Marsarchaeota archaeon]|nr:hypothetical protein [Candidatus Marsarchaeota archaeon]
MAKIRNIDYILDDVDTDTASERQKISTNEDLEDIDNTDFENKTKNNDNKIEGIRKPIGTIEYFFKKIDVAAIKLYDSISIGDVIEIVGANTIMTQRISSIQINKESVIKANKGDSVGIVVDNEVKKGYMVYKLY